MTLSEFLKIKKLSYSEFGRQIDVNKMSIRRYAVQNTIPRPEIMVKITQATEGQVTANDFYNSPTISHIDEKKSIDTRDHP